MSSRHSRIWLREPKRSRTLDRRSWATGILQVYSNGFTATAVAVECSVEDESRFGARTPEESGSQKSRGRWSFAASATARLQVMRTKGVLACRMRSPRTCWMYPMPQHHVRAPQWISICAPLHSRHTYPHSCCSVGVLQRSEVLGQGIHRVHSWRLARLPRDTL